MKSRITLDLGLRLTNQVWHVHLLGKSVQFRHLQIGSSDPSTPSHCVVAYLRKLVAGRQRKRLTVPVSCADTVIRGDVCTSMRRGVNRVVDEGSCNLLRTYPLHDGVSSEAPLSHSPIWNGY